MAAVGKFEVLERLGLTWTGEIFLARNPDLDRQVIIKRLAPSLVGADVLTRLRREAQLMAQVSSAHCVRVLDYVEEGGYAWIVTEQVDGTTLGRLLAGRGTLRPEQSLAVLRGAVSGLEAVHGAGLLHRDVRPETIVVTAEGTSKLADFSQMTVAGARGEPPSGAAAYMSPELARGEPGDARSDVYSAGCVLYHCLEGSPPFDGQDAEEVLRNHAMVPAPVAAHAPEGLRVLVAASLAKQPGQRPATAAAFALQLEQAGAEAFGSDWLQRGAVASLAGTAALAAGTVVPGLLAGGGGAASAAGAVASVFTGAPPISGGISTPPSAVPAAPAPSVPVNADVHTAATHSGAAAHPVTTVPHPGPHPGGAPQTPPATHPSTGGGPTSGSVPAPQPAAPAPAPHQPAPPPHAPTPPPHQPAPVPHTPTPAPHQPAPSPHDPPPAPHQPPPPPHEPHHPPPPPHTPPPHEPAPPPHVTSPTSPAPHTGAPPVARRTRRGRLGRGAAGLAVLAVGAGASLVGAAPAAGGRGLADRFDGAATVTRSAVVPPAPACGAADLTVTITLHLAAPGSAVAGRLLLLEVVTTPGGGPLDGARQTVAVGSDGTAAVRATGLPVSGSITWTTAPIALDGRPLASFAGEPISAHADCATVGAAGGSGPAGGGG